MKKKLASVVSALLMILSYLPQWGWTQMPDWVAPTARILFWLFLSTTIVIVILIFWGKKIAQLIPTIRIEKHQREYINSILIAEEQRGHEEQWLRPVIEWIDFNRQWLPTNQIMLKYQIDSGLVYDFKPYRMWIKLRIGQYEPKDGWEILQTPNLLKGKRSQFASEVFTINDSNLLKIIERCKRGLQIAQTLRIIVQLRQGDKLEGLESSYSINPYSEFVRETQNDTR